ncbi:MAG: methyltransferase small [Chitinophagaceae bacterium]|nr:methyltransferase small [Chitinophagaceae bacterium]
MSNSFFQFKQFIVHQSNAALKVCTESCIFGAAIPTEEAKYILDIGTGTGLLALMLAQRSNAAIEAVELDQPSCEDACKNFNESIWSDRLSLHQEDIKTFAPHAKFDLIVSNPPFFIKQLKSANARTNAALHGSELKPDDLCAIVNRLSSDNAKFYVLLPEKEMQQLAEQMENSGWIKIYRLNVYQEEHKTIFRTIAGFSKNEQTKKCVRKDLIIYNKDRSYTPDFVSLLKEYYLYL